jgi:hypothetical protein
MVPSLASLPQVAAGRSHCKPQEAGTHAPAIPFTQPLPYPISSEEEAGPLFEL